MTVAELLELTAQRLGDTSRTYYPASLLITFVNHAQNLMALLPQYEVRQRTSTTLNAGSCFLDLRILAPRYLSIRRVVLGNVVTQAEALASSGTIQRLYPISLDGLAARRRWVDMEGVPRLYFVHGRTLLGVYPRAASDIIVSVMTRALPALLSVNTPAQESQIQPSNHPLIADVATGLVLLREGTTEGQKGLAMLAQVLPQAMLQGLSKALGGLKQQAVSRQLSNQEA